MQILKTKNLFLLLPVVVLLGCSDVSGDKTPVDSNSDTDANNGSITENVMAVVATAAADYSSGAHAIIRRDDSGQLSALNNLLPTDSDISVAAHGNYFYRIGRFGAGNSITRFSFDAPQTIVWQYSVNDIASATPSNPHDMVFASENKAYVLRYGSTRAWIVNPSTTDEAGFKTGELDLSAYGNSKGIPYMDSAVIVNGKLFITLQRLEGQLLQPDNDSCLAVFDIATDQEIDTGRGGGVCNGNKGIKLSGRNPTDIFYDKNSNRIFVLSSGSTLPPLKYVGGIESVDPDSYAAKLVLDDGDASSHPYGVFFQMALAPPNRLYFVGYEGWRNTTLYQLDLTTGQVVASGVAPLISGDIADLAIDGQGHLWVADNANATIRVLDGERGDELDAVSTSLNPLKIVFKP